MTASEILVDALGRIPDMVHGAVDGLTQKQLATRLDPDANSIVWLVWHLSRIEDDHVSRLAARPQLWTADGWSRRWGLGLDDADVGYGHTSAQVASVTADGPLLLGYFDAAHRMATDFVQSIEDPELDRVIDRRWDPPVTVGVRLVSVAAHNFQQAGQAEFIRGVLDSKQRSSPGRAK